MFSRIGRRLRQFLNDFWAISLGHIFDFIADNLGQALILFTHRFLAHDSPGPLQDVLARFFGDKGAQAGAQIEGALNEAGPILRPIAKVLAVFFTVPTILASTIAGLLERLRQDSFAETRPSIFDLPTAAEAWNRGFIDGPTALNQAARGGYEDWQFGVVAQMIRRRLSATEYGELARRGVIPREQLDDWLKSIGHEPTEAGLVFELSRRLLTAAELASALRRNEIDANTAFQKAAQAGVEPQDFELLFRLTRNLLATGDVVSSWLRGLISEAELDGYLSKLGYEDRDIQLIKQLAFFIPPPSDLIRMAVREVFSPQVAERFGQFEDFPEEFRQFAAMQGISEFWARAYWAAHWELPSITQGFEMFHREVISRDDLELLLRAQDVMPFWRDKLLQISYNPVGRIDILRMYQLGVIDRDEVERRFRHLGYSPEDAKILAEYTIRLAAQREKDLSRTDIEELLSAGMITEDKAKELLLRNGYTEEIANLILARIELKLAQEAVQDELEAIRAKFLAGVMSFDDVVRQVSQLQLPGTMLDTFLAKLQREANKQIRRLTLAEIRQAFIRNIITEDDARNRLKTYGYPPADIEVLIGLWKAGVTQQ